MTSLPHFVHHKHSVLHLVYTCGDCSHGCWGFLQLQLYSVTVKRDVRNEQSQKKLDLYMRVHVHLKSQLSAQQESLFLSALSFDQTCLMHSAACGCVQFCMDGVGVFNLYAVHM